MIISWKPKISITKCICNWTSKHCKITVAGLLCVVTRAALLTIAPLFNKQYVGQYKHWRHWSSWSRQLHVRCSNICTTHTTPFMSWEMFAGTNASTYSVYYHLSLQHSQSVKTIQASQNSFCDCFFVSSFSCVSLWWFRSLVNRVRGDNKQIVLVLCAHVLLQIFERSQ